MKGIVLAGGLGSRLYPATLGLSKQLLPVYDKPMIFYPLATLLRAQIRDIMIISTPRDLPLFRCLLGSGAQYGVKFSYRAQPQPRGIAQAFILARRFIGKDKVCLILGDNIFYARGLPQMLKKCGELKKGAHIFGCRVPNPQAYGVLQIKNGKALNIEEKPQKPLSPWAVTGLYFYDNDVIKIAQKLKPSKRGELEITDINNAYLKRGELTVNFLPRAARWLDSGTHGNLVRASEFVETMQKRKSIRLGCLEEIAFNNGWIGKKALLAQGRKMRLTSYGQYLLVLAAKGGK